jgi:hypothetical protein
MDELPQVRIADCGCVILADAKPVGYRFKATPQGDARMSVYACPQHDHTRRQEVSEATRTPVRPPRAPHKA